VQSDGKEVAYGTVIAADGWIITKATQVNREIICIFRDGRELPATVSAVHDQFDLALLKVEAKDLKPIRFTPSKSIPAGNWVAATSNGDDPVAVGVISVPTRTLPKRELDMETLIPQGGYLGIQMETVEGAKGVRVMQVMPNTAASKAGLKKDDIIIRIGETVIDKQQKIFDVLSQTRPGDVVKMLIVREDEEKKIEVTLGKRPGNGRADFQNSMGNEMSQRKAGFPIVIQHDTVLRPIDCGGPLVDLEGRVIGINVARSGRVESLAIPTEALEPIIKELRAGKSTPPTAINRFKEVEKKTSTPAPTKGLGNIK